MLLALSFYIDQTHMLTLHIMGQQTIIRKLPLRSPKGIPYPSHKDNKSFSCRFKSMNSQFFLPPHTYLHRTSSLCKLINENKDQFIDYVRNKILAENCIEQLYLHDSPNATNK